jgi:protein subunit release factor A
MSEKDRLQRIVERAKEAKEPQEKLRRAQELLESIGRDEEIKQFANNDIDRLIADIKNQADKKRASQ